MLICSYKDTIRFAIYTVMNIRLLPATLRLIVNACYTEICQFWWLAASRHIALKFRFHSHCWCTYLYRLGCALRSSVAYIGYTFTCYGCAVNLHAARCTALWMQIYAGLFHIVITYYKAYERMGDVTACTTPRVTICGKHRPSWPICFTGVQKNSRASETGLITRLLICIRSHICSGCAYKC